MRRVLATLLGLAALIAVGFVLEPERETGLLESVRSSEGRRQPVVGLADPDNLREQYETWKGAVEDPWLFDLQPSSLLDDPRAAKGWVSVDVERGLIESEVYGTVDEGFDLWFVDNQESAAVPEYEDVVMYVGTYSFEGGAGVLRVETERFESTPFTVDTAVVTPLGFRPHQGGLFYGAPDLFQRLYVLEQRMEREARGRTARLFSLGAVALQGGGVPTGFPDVFSDLVTQGEDLFFNETFEGNGRTCGTCHFATENFTLSTELIASLPPKDPLFLAEFSPPHIFGDPQNLDPDGNPRRFENPALMRAFGLIVENLDGTGDLDERFTMRGIPHNVGMRVSVTRPPGSIEFPEGPDERTGWSGDGSPFGSFFCPTGVEGALPSPSNIITVRGTTRSFALGAVIQHFPRTLDRDFCKTNPDFRLPTERELDAFGAFLFALGRQSELELDDGAPNQLVLADPNAEEGKILFRDADASGNVLACNNCHTNGGANAAFAGDTNQNFDTNVEEFLQNRIMDPEFTVVGEPRPVDGGFGHNPEGTFDRLEATPPFVNEHFGDGTFNTVSLVEAADSGPFFHTNHARTLEESIEFYASDEFAMNFPRIVLNSEQVAQVAAFLRAINALDNIESLATPRAKKAIDALNLTHPNEDDVINFLLEVAIADTQDAIEVLEASDLHNSGGLPVNAVKQLDQAAKRFGQAQNTNASDLARVGKINDGLQHLSNAVGIIRVSP